MGQIREKVIVKNFVDIYKYKEGLIPENEIKELEVEAIVDTGTSFLCLSPEQIKKLGLLFSYSRSLITANGNVERRIFSVASITIHDREIKMDVMENDSTTPPLIGYLVLENMDLVVNLSLKKLTGNPEHDGKWVMDLL